MKRLCLAITFVVSIGLVAQASSLSAALLILAVLQVGVAASGWLLRL